MLLESPSFQGPGPYGDLFNLEKIQSVSLLVLKPECHFLLPEEKTTLTRSITEVANEYGMLGAFWVQLDLDTAYRLWMPDIGQYPWATHYCEFMTTKPCRAFVLSGVTSAATAKREIRRTNNLPAAIKRLQKFLNLPFCPDLVHGSDEEDWREELQVFLSKSIDLNF